MRSTIISANRAPFDPRQARLKAERLRLERLNRESDYVRVVPFNVLEGSEPEHYRVTFLCRGIVGVGASQRPIYGHTHEVEIFCDEDFPSDAPRLRWVSPIWHPNIQHQEPKSVCVNKPEWLGGMGLDDLCRLLFEMVQYKNYHATFTKPYPLDKDVAKWVLEYAEPHNIVNKKRSIFVDDKPFTRPTVTSYIKVSDSDSAPEPRIRIVPSPDRPTEPSKVKLTNHGANSKNEDPPPVPAARVKILKKE
jgi:ubiquitin-protein ligase